MGTIYTHTTRTAWVIGTYDDGSPWILEDERGWRWRICSDRRDGTESVLSEGQYPPLSGEFHWGDGDDDGEIVIAWPETTSISDREGIAITAD